MSRIYFIRPNRFEKSSPVAFAKEAAYVKIAMTYIFLNTDRVWLLSTREEQRRHRWWEGGYRVLVKTNSTCRSVPNTPYSRVSSAGQARRTKKENQNENNILFVNVPCEYQIRLVIRA